MAEQGAALSPIAEAKAAARRSIRALLRSRAEALGPAALEEAARRAEAVLAAQPEYRAADLVLAFLSMPGEIDTAPLIEAALAEGKPLAVPRIEGEELGFVLLPQGYRAWPRDRYGIPEPPAELPALGLSELARRSLLVVAPGLAFGRDGSRLGRGKGFYDRFLAALRGAGGSPRVAGYGLAVQVLDAVPAGPGDEGVDFVCTEEGRVSPAAQNPGSRSVEGSR